MGGHATDKEIKKVKSLEKTLSLDESSIDTLLELAQLYIEPCHRESDAIRLYEIILKRDPQNSAAKFWLAYCCIWYLMDEDALKRAITLLENIIATDKNFTGAAYILLAEAMGDLHKLPMDGKIKFLEASIKYEPNWVYNHQYLAWAYQAAGRYNDTLDQVELALANLKKYGSDFANDNSIFENEITGRASHNADEELKKIKADPKGLLSKKTMTEGSFIHHRSLKLPFIIGGIVFSFSFLFGGIYTEMWKERLGFSIQNILFPLLVSFMRGFMASFITWIVIDIAKRIQKEDTNLSIKGWRWIFYILGWIFGFANLFFWLILYLIHLAKDASGPFINKNFHKRVYIWGIVMSILIISIGILAVVLIPIMK